MLSKPSKAFEEIRELVRIVSVAGPRRRAGLSLDLVEKSVRPSARLFRLLRDDRHVSEIGAERHLFASAPHHATKVFNFAKLKSRLKSNLLDTIFLLNLSEAGYSEYSQIIYAVNRSVFLARVLSTLGARDLAISIAKSGYAKAMHVEEWVCAAELLVILRSGSVRHGDARAFNFLIKEYEQCQRLISSENEAAIAMQTLQLAYSESAGEKPEHAAIAEAGAQKVRELTNYPSFKLQFYEIRLSTAAAQLKMDYRVALENCDRASALFQQYPIFANRARRAEFAILGLLSAVQLQLHDIAEREVSQCESLLRMDENNWFSFKEYQFLHLLHTLQFDQAHQVVKSVLSNSRLENQPQPNRDKWALFQLYSEYLTGERVPVATLNDLYALVPSFSSDKTGMNTSILILHILLLAQRKQFSDLRDRLEFVKGYRKRHLKGEQNSHAAHFFAMLGSIEAQDLNFKMLRRKSTKMLVTLREMETEPLQGEVLLPYSFVWQRLMDALEDYDVLHHRTSGSTHNTVR